MLCKLEDDACSSLALQTLVTRTRWLRTLSTGNCGHERSRAPFRDGGGPNEKWVTDLTYIPTREGWLYVAVVLDIYSRRVVGWSMKKHMEQGLVASALRMATAHRRPGEGMLHHSDRGS